MSRALAIIRAQAELRALEAHQAAALRILHAMGTPEADLAIIQLEVAQGIALRAMLALNAADEDRDRR